MFYNGTYGNDRELLIARICKMTASEGHKKGGGKLSRSETVTVRLDPKLRYLAELAARKQRRTLSSFIEWAIEQSLKDVQIQNVRKGESSNLHDVSDALWDVGPAERLVRLALKCPEFLNYKEQRIWKLVDEWPALWDTNEEERRCFRFDLLNNLWNEFEQYGGEEIEEKELTAKVVAYCQQSGRPPQSMTIFSHSRYIDEEF
jgi:hypothetical protein